MAYVAMNMQNPSKKQNPTFLNGVCRHEHNLGAITMSSNFLNGVCRHELARLEQSFTDQFLNGVCRHELWISGN